MLVILRVRKWFTPKPNHNKPSHPHVLSWAVFLSKGFRGMSEHFRARNHKPFFEVQNECPAKHARGHPWEVKVPQNPSFLNPWFGEPVVCTLDPRGFRHCRGFRDFRYSSTQTLVCSCLSVFVVFVVFVISVVFAKGDPHTNHRFTKP